MNDTFHPHKGPYLADLAAGDQFLGFYTLRSKQLEPFRDASRGFYLTLVLSDRSGQMIARVWENAEDLFPELPQGQVIKVEGEVEAYKGRLQGIIMRLRSAEPSEFDPRDMLPSSSQDIDEMVASFHNFLAQMGNPHLRALVQHFFQQPPLMEAFSQAPAARRIHHAYLGGLLEHTLEVIAICQTVRRLYPQIDGDLLVAGAILHDIGKLREYSWDLDLDYTDEGRLLGHIVMTDEMVTKALVHFPDFPPELALRLRHLLLAHHGRVEWGSPQPPKTLEAIALHHVENLSAQINRFQQLLANRPLDQLWTDYDRLLGRQLYGGAEAEDLGDNE